MLGHRCQTNVPGENRHFKNVKNSKTGFFSPIFYREYIDRK